MDKQDERSNPQRKAWKSHRSIIRIVIRQTWASYIKELKRKSLWLQSKQKLLEVLGEAIYQEGWRD